MKRFYGDLYQVQLEEFLSVIKILWWFVPSAARRVSIIWDWDYVGSANWVDVFI
jgi:hypothetical protein